MRARKALQATPPTPRSTVSPSILSTTHSVPTSNVPSVAPPDPPSQDTEPTPAPVTVTPSTTKRKLEKSPLSESTVLVERSDAEEMDVDS